MSQQNATKAWVEVQDLTLEQYLRMAEDLDEQAAIDALLAEDIAHGRVADWEN